MWKGTASLPTGDSLRIVAGMEAHTNFTKVIKGTLRDMLAWLLIQQAAGVSDGGSPTDDGWQFPCGTINIVLAFGNEARD
jgi:hypothetical protein